MGHQAVRDHQGRTRAFFESGYAFTDGYLVIKRSSFTSHCLKSWSVFTDVIFLLRYLCSPLAQHTNDDTPPVHESY